MNEVFNAITTTKQSIHEQFVVFLSYDVGLNIGRFLFCNFTLQMILEETKKLWKNGKEKN
jgi:hypothetical protein